MRIEGSLGTRQEIGERERKTDRQTDRQTDRPWQALKIERDR